MRVVVAGGTGFIGNSAARALSAAGHEVVPLGRADLEAVLAGARPDLRERCDVLVWAAGRREADLAANRAIHVAAPVEAVRALAAPRVVYLSSGECYGDAPLPYREDGPALAATDYARAKLEGERAVEAVAATTVLRVGVGYGPGQSPRMLIPQVVTALRAGQRIGLTHGEQTRDFVFIDDIAEAIVAAVARPERTLVNIASGVETSVRDACLAIARALGASEALLGFGDIPTRPDEPRRYVLDVTRAADVLGWRARTSLAEGAARL